MTKSDIIDIAMHLHAETAIAIKVSDNGDAKSAVWLPKSQVEFEKAGGGNVCVTLPEWLAIGNAMHRGGKRRAGDS